MLSDLFHVNRRSHVPKSHDYCQSSKCATLIPEGLSGKDYVADRASQMFVALVSPGDQDCTVDRT